MKFRTDDMAIETYYLTEVRIELAPRMSPRSPPARPGPGRN